MATNKIVQLTEWEYNKLFESAKATEEDIKKRALEMYKEKGVCEIRLNMDINESYDRTLSIDTSGRIGGCYDADFKLSFSQHRDASRWIDESLRDLVYRKFGIKLERFNELRKGLERDREVFRNIALTGWLVAIVLVGVVCLMK